MICYVFLSFVGLLGLSSRIVGEESDEFMFEQFKKLVAVFDRGAKLPYVPLKKINNKTWLFKELVKMLAKEQEKKKRNF